jgi:hypothetical protein
MGSSQTQSTLTSGAPKLHFIKMDGHSARVAVHKGVVTTSIRIRMTGRVFRVSFCRSQGKEAFAHFTHSLSLLSPPLTE